MPPLDTILSLADAGTPIRDIAAAVDLSESRIYGILREHRPVRARTPRRATCAIPTKIQALAAAGATPARAMHVLGVSKAYVYRWWPKQEGS